MRTLVRKPSRAGDTVRDLCACSSSTAKAFIMLDPLRKFVGCDLDSRFLTTADTDNLLTSVFQVLKSKSGANSSREVKAFAKIVTEKIDAPLVSKKGSVCEVPLGLDALQVVPSDILQFSFTIFEDYFLYELCRRLPLNMCQLVWPGLLHSLDPKELLAHECGLLRVSIWQSAMCLEKAWKGLFVC